MGNKIRKLNKLEEVCFDGVSLDDGIILLNTLKSDYKEYEDLYFESEVVDVPYSNDSYERCFLYGYIKETDLEFSTRLKEEKELKDKSKLAKEVAKNKRKETLQKEAAKLGLILVPRQL